MSYYIGIKMGSTNTAIYKPGNGVVLKEPSLIAMSVNPKIREIKAIGNDAKVLKNRLPENIAVYSPISDGVIQYESLAVLMLKHFLKKVLPKKPFGQNIRAIVSTPVGLSPEEKKMFEITCFKSGIADVTLVPDVFCYALGNGIDIQSERASMIVDIGGNTTNIAIISNYTILQGYNITIGGSIITSAIIKYIHETYGVLIDPNKAEQLQIELCSLLENYHSSVEIEGYNTKTESPESIVISSSELYPIIIYYYGKIADSIKSIIQDCTPQVIADISKNGIYYYGNSSNIIGIDKFMSSRLSFKSNVSENFSNNMIGIGELIKYPQILHKITKNL